MDDGTPDLADLDFGNDAHQLNSGEAIKALADLDHMLLDLERAQAEQLRLEGLATKNKQLVEKLATKEIPELLNKLRMKEGVTQSGIQFKLRREIRAALPGKEHVERRLNAFAWLNTNGHGGVIKNVVSVDLERGQDERADDLVIELRGKGFDAQAMKDVHGMTLSALVRELLEAGKTIPTGTFSVFDDLKVKISRKS